MSKSQGEFAVEILLSFREDLYKIYNEKLQKDPTFDKEFGEFIGEQFQYIFNALKSED